MKKRILSILLMCCMVLTLLPVQALAEDSAYTVGEDTGVSARALAGTAGTKLKADNIDTYLANGLGDGVYTLAEDVTISGTLRVTTETAEYVLYPGDSIYFESTVLHHLQNNGEEEECVAIWGEVPFTW